MTQVDVLRSEWTKLRSLRSTGYAVAVTVVLALGLGALISAGLGDSYHQRPPDEQALFDPTYSSLFGCFLFAQLAIGALGILTVTSEYGTGMIRTSLTAVPRRGWFLAAKMLVVAGAALAIGLTVAFGSFLVGQPVLAGQDAPHSTLGDPNVLRAVVGAGWWLAAIALLGLAFGMLLRSTAGAFAVLVGVTLMAPLLSGMMPAWFGEWWPTMAGMGILRTVPDPTSLGPWGGIALLYGTAAALLAAAYAVLRARDA